MKFYLLACLATAAVATSFPLHANEASVSMGRVSVSLIDLDPFDNTRPALFLANGPVGNNNGGSYVAANVYGPSTNLTPPRILFNNKESFIRQPALTSLTPVNSITASFKQATSTAATGLTGTSVVASAFGEYTLAGGNASNTFFDLWRVTPKTRVILTARATMNASITDECGITVCPYVQTAAALNFYNVGGGFASSDSFVFIGDIERQTELSFSGSKTLAVAFDNELSSYMTIGYGTGLYAVARSFGDNTYPTPIPEPSTYALMLLGLLPIALRGRARQRRPQH